MLLQTKAPPLRQESTGAIRIGKSRVLLELVIRAFDDGATPESIVQMYPTTTLADIYSVIGFYLHNRDEVIAYMVERELEAEKVYNQIQDTQGDMTNIRDRLLARKNSPAN